MVAYYRDISLTMREMDTVKDTFDKAILANNYGILQTCVIEIPGSIGFANYACIAPDYDLYGRKIKILKMALCTDYISRSFLKNAVHLFF